MLISVLNCMLGILYLSSFFPQKLEVKSLIKLNFSKNNDGNYAFVSFCMWDPIFIEYCDNTKRTFWPWMWFGAYGWMVWFWLLKMRVQLLAAALTVFSLSVGKHHCPVMYNIFTNNSHIVANKVTGNVYSYEVGTLLCCSLNFLNKSRMTDVAYVIYMLI